MDFCLQKRDKKISAHLASRFRTNKFVDDKFGNFCALKQWAASLHTNSRLCVFSTSINEADYNGAEQKLPSLHSTVTVTAFCQA